MNTIEKGFSVASLTKNLPQYVNLRFASLRIVSLRIENAIREKMKDAHCMADFNEP